jgi:hypothetical protein
VRVPTQTLPLLGVVALALAGCSGGTVDAVSARASADQSMPSWVTRAEARTQNLLFGGARPVRRRYIGYPRKLAVVWTFERAVACLKCHQPYGETPLRTRFIRLSFDRRTHRWNGGIRFCKEPSTCLAR